MATSTQIESLPTIGVIADKLGARVHQVRHIIDSRGITPTRRAGAAYVYSDSDVERITREYQARHQREEAK